MMISLGNYRHILKLFTLTVLLSNYAIAERSDSYIGFALASEKSSSHLYEEGALAGILLRSGYEIGENFGVEIRMSATFESEEQIKHDYSAALYMKPKARIGRNLTLYGLLGYGIHRISFPTIEEFTDAKVVNSKTSVAAFSYGAGMEFYVNHEWSFFLEAMQVVDEGKKASEGLFEIDVEGIYFGVNYRFDSDDNIFKNMLF